MIAWRALLVSRRVEHQALAVVLAAEETPMSKHLWNGTVTVATRDPGKYVTINDTKRAMQFLLQEWPKDKPDKLHALAKKILINAHEGRASVDDARDAFMAAAVAIGILWRD